MTIVNLFSDVHLGISRKANTTQESSERWNEKIFRQAESLLVRKYNLIAGDLFDKTFNHEKYILQGFKLAERSIVLSGNHDETNREDTVSSLKALSRMLPTIIRNEDVTVVGYHETHKGRIVMVPHCATQELFIKCLEMALREAEEGSHLVVHCNRGIIMEGVQADSTLYIDEEMEARLTEKFATVFYGHEHKPFFSEKVVVLGNVFPTSFSDISDKYRCELNLDTGEKKWIKTFDASKHYLKLDLKDLDSVNKETFFVEVTGEYPSREVNEAIQKLRSDNSNLLAVRSLCNYTDKTNVEVVDIDLQALEKVIEKELKGSDLEEVYLELRNEQ